MATYAICASTGTLPDSMADYEAYRVFNASFSGLSLVVGRSATGEDFLMAGADAAVVDLGPLPAQFSPEVEGLADPVPAPGIDGPHVRALLVDPSAAAQLLDEPEQSILFTQLPGFLHNGLTHIPGFIPPANAPPAETPAEARLGVMALVLQGAINDAPARWRQVEVHRSAQSLTGRPETLAALAALYGGLNEAAWMNPYTGEPMRNVPADAPVPGDYTELPDASGVVILLHYRDAAGSVSSRVIGNRKDARLSDGRTPMQPT